jgi:extradiol dioxygenase family protein
LCRHLENAGISFIAAPKVSPDGKAKVAFCFDLEGNCLELVEEIL